MSNQFLTRQKLYSFFLKKKRKKVIDDNKTNKFNQEGKPGLSGFSLPKLVYLWLSLNGVGIVTRRAETRRGSGRSLEPGP